MVGVLGGAGDGLGAKALFGYRPVDDSDQGADRQGRVIVGMNRICEHEPATVNEIGVVDRLPHRLVGFRRLKNFIAREVATQVLRPGRGQHLAVGIDGQKLAEMRILAAQLLELRGDRSALVLDEDILHRVQHAPAAQIFGSPRDEARQVLHAFAGDPRQVLLDIATDRLLGGIEGAHRHDRQGEQRA